MTEVLTAGEASAPRRSLPLRPANRFLRRRRGLALGALVGPAALWLMLIYIVSLVLLAVSSLFELDTFTSQPTTNLTLDNLRTAFTTSTSFRVVWRSVSVAATVTVICLVIALPTAFYIAKVAKVWARRGLMVAMLMPLWAGYLVKVYAWRAVLRPGSPFGVDKNGGFLDSVLGFTPGFGRTAVIIGLTYHWLPFMVLPIYAGLDRLPSSLLDAAGDLGAKPLRTFRTVIVPMLIPSIAAGSIFTFSLSLGDYITPSILSDGKLTMIGNLIESTININQPLAAAYTMWPLLITTVYLFGMRSAGAFESL